MGHKSKSETDNKTPSTQSQTTKQLSKAPLHDAPPATVDTHSPSWIPQNPSMVRLHRSCFCPTHLRRLSGVAPPNDDKSSTPNLIIHIISWNYNIMVYHLYDIYIYMCVCEMYLASHPKQSQNVGNTVWSRRGLSFLGFKLLLDICCQWVICLNDSWGFHAVSFRHGHANFHKKACPR